MKPWADKHFGSRSWTFQHDSIPPHSARVNQEWLKKEVPLLISTAQWPPKSANLNQLAFAPEAFWLVRFSLKKYQSVDHLKMMLRRKWAKKLQLFGHLRAIVGGQFEQI